MLKKYKIMSFRTSFAAFSREIAQNLKICENGGHIEKQDGRHFRDFLMMPFNCYTPKTWG